MDKPQRDGEHKEASNLARKWYEHLTQNKTTCATPLCVFCRDQKVFPNEEELWRHTLEKHPEKVPEDKEARENFRRGETLGPVSNRYYNSTSSNPHASLVVVDSELQKLTANNLQRLPVKSGLKRKGLGYSTLSVITTDRADFPAPEKVDPQVQYIGSDSSLSLTVSTSNNAANETILDEPPKMEGQVEARPMSHEELAAKVKHIYAELTREEGICFQADTKVLALLKESPQQKLHIKYWQTLNVLHLGVIRLFLKFFFTSQHPSATNAVRNSAIKNHMPARLWGRGIHPVLEIQREGLPDSLEHMIGFIYFAYSMMTRLYETIPAFEQNWVECLGDLGRYRMVISDNDMRERQVWKQVSRQWYLKASDLSPQTGRLYHHLAILARPNVLQQLFYFYKSLSVPQVFTAGIESILTIFRPTVEGNQQSTYIRLHVILFTQKAKETFDPTLAELPGYLSSHIGRVKQNYLKQGYYIAISNILTLFGNSALNAILARVFSKSDTSAGPDGCEALYTDITRTSIEGKSSDIIAFEQARLLFVLTIKIHLQRVGDPNILSFLHVTMVFMVFLSASEKDIKLLEKVEKDFPWVDLVAVLNTLLYSYHRYPRIEGENRPVPEKTDFRPVPEEFAMRGLEWATTYFPSGWFANKNIEEENQFKEDVKVDATMNSEYRPECILWLGCRLAQLSKWLRYHNHKFYIPIISELNDALRFPAASSDVELDPGNESPTDTATIMADSDDHSSTMAPKPEDGLGDKDVLPPLHNMKISNY